MISDPYFITCVTCNGTGLEGGFPCSGCGGNKKTLLRADHFPDDIFPTYKVVEATDDTEYSALSSAQKTVYSMIISLGTVDLSSGTAIKTKLWNMFGAGTTTRANLEALIA